MWNKYSYENITKYKNNCNEYFSLLLNMACITITCKWWTSMCNAITWKHIFHRKKAEWIVGEGEKKNINDILLNEFVNVIFISVLKFL